MKSLSISSILLFPLVIFFIMQYRIGPGDTPYLFFGIIFLLLLSYLVLDITSFSPRVYDLIKNVLLWVIIVVVLGSAFGSSLIVRHQTAPTYGVHDIILQQEAAIRYFVHGKNPYKETYFGTPMEAWHYSDTEINPALYHYVMEPFYTLFPLPFYYLSNHIVGFFDAREVLWLLFGLSLVIAFFVPKESEMKRTFVTLLAFNPAMLGYTLEGRSDFFMYGFFMLGLFLLWKKQYFWAGIPMALAFCVKQSVWPFMPFYIVFLFTKYFSQKSSLLEKGKKFIIHIAPFILVSTIITVPFYLWNPSAFLQSTVYYLSGNTTHSYPISGYGFGMILSQFGVIKDIHQYYPFQILQLSVGIPVLVLLMWYVYERPTMQRLIFSYGIFLFAFWYFARYFNNSHLGYLSVVFLTAYFWPNPSDKKGYE